MQTAIPYMQFRGGSSKGLYFTAGDLPTDETERNRIVLAAMEGVGHGDQRQIDGMGGATSLTSKAAVVSRSSNPDADLDYLFLQVVIGKGKVSTTQTCGNILAAVVPFAIEAGMITPGDITTAVRVNMLNTGGICEVTVQTPGGVVNYAGSVTVDGVPGTAAPVICNYLETTGSTCGALLPTGSVLNVIDGVEVTCIDNGMPTVILKAADAGISGYETPAKLNSMEALKRKLESIRLLAGPLMNLGDVTDKTVPKMCLVSPAIHAGALHTRTFIPQVCHEAIGVLGAVSVASAILLDGSVASKVSRIAAQQNYISIEHPTGEFSIQFETIEENGTLQFKKCGVIRTARLISKGFVYIP